MKLIQIANEQEQAVQCSDLLDLGVVDRKIVCNDLNAFEFTGKKLIINRPGYYLVKFNGNYTATGSNNVTNKLLLNDKHILTAASGHTANEGDIFDLHFSKIIRVFSNNSTQGNMPAILSIENSGADATLNILNFSVIKVG